MPERQRRPLGLWVGCPQEGLGAMYQVIRIAVDELGRPISGCVEHVYGKKRVPQTPLDIGPFDTVEDVYRRLEASLTIQQSLW